MRAYTTFLSLAGLISAAGAFPQYSVTRMATLAPGLAPFHAINSVGNMIKPYLSNPSRLLLRNVDGSYALSSGAPSGYSNGGSYALSDNNRVAGSLSRSYDPIKAYPMTWSQETGYDILPSPIVSTEPSAAYDMYAINENATVFGGSFNTYIGGVHNYVPTRWHQSGSSWVGESFNGEGVCMEFDQSGNAYGRFNGRSGIWSTDGTVGYLPSPYSVFNQAVGRDDQGHTYGQTVENNAEFWVWDTPTSTPRRYPISTFPYYQFFPMRVNGSGTCIYTTEKVPSSGLLNGFLWSESTGSVQLDNLLLPEDAAMYQVGAVKAINDQGVILAFARDPALPSVEFGVVLTPVPEPATLLLMSVGIGYLVAQRRKRR